MSGIFNASDFFPAESSLVVGAFHDPRQTAEWGRRDSNGEPWQGVSITRP